MDGELARIRDLETKEAPFVIWDIAGWCDHGSAHKRFELGYILDGNVPNRFDLSQSISPQSRDFITAPNQADKVHCMCLVIPSTFSCYNGEDMCRVREMKKYATDRGIPMLIFLTKVDQRDAEVAADISKLKTSALVMKTMQELAQRTGIGGANDVFPIKTFSSEYEPDKAVGILTLRALQHALYAVVDSMEAAQMDLSQWQPTTLLGRSPLQLAQQDSPHLGEALATTTASKVPAQTEKDCDMESADWEAVLVNPLNAPHS
ncbi:probable interferon-induced protein 44 [Coccomyxa sp. Obi]|nr:probable interferon-induced protein 44 [Coccomyxa sp. Obi]